jgi:hypothetical protein
VVVVGGGVGLRGPGAQRGDNLFACPGLLAAPPERAPQAALGIRDNRRAAGSAEPARTQLLTGPGGRQGGPRWRPWARWRRRAEDDPINQLDRADAEPESADPQNPGVDQ